MDSLFSITADPKDRLRRNLLVLAVIFTFFYSLILTLSPAVRVHSWNAEYRWLHWIGFLVWFTLVLLLEFQVKKIVPESDPFLLPLGALLTGWGLLTIWRLDENLGLRQTIWLGASSLLFFVALRQPKLLKWLRRYKYIWLSIGLLLTGLTFFLGKYPGGEGPRLWLGCCGIYLQPSEPLKILLIIYLAAYLADQAAIRLQLGTLIIPSLVVVGAAILILVAQRDLGTASLIIAFYTLIVYLAIGKRRILLIAAVILIAAGIAGYFLFNVIQYRVDAWINPWADPGGRSYQIIQSLLAFANGGLIGTGPGLGSPGLVPVAHSDFIAAAIGEETGLLGIGGLVIVYALLVVRGFSAALRAPNHFQRLLAAGIAIYLGAQATLILGGNLRMLPLTGVTLPFVSYGGSSLVTSLFALFLLILISGQSNEEQPILEKTTPYLLVGGALMAGFFLLTLLAGWWGIFRSVGLNTRPDNLRWVISDRFVPRGSILDRQNQSIAVSTGDPGSITRKLLYPPLSTTIGYNDPLYGKGGLEYSLDEYLRGLQGNPASTIWYSQIVYAQPPNGLNIRLSLDLSLQQKADELLGNQTGSVVLLNAQTGELLVLASHPYFDPGTLQENWDAWVADPSAPLVNRAVQGQYPIGTTLGPFLLTTVAIQSGLPALPEKLSASIAGNNLSCALPPTTPLTWESVVAAGCPNPIAELSKRLSTGQILDLQRKLGFFDTPAIPLETAEASPEAEINDSLIAALGLTDLKVTPLQMALAAATLSADGIRPAPRLAIAVETPHQGWVVLPSDPSVRALTYSTLNRQIKNFGNTDLPIWHSSGLASDQDQQFTWFLAGTLPDWQGTPLALVVLLEDNQPALAENIGAALLKTAINPAAK